MDERTEGEGVFFRWTVEKTNSFELSLHSKLNSSEGPVAADRLVCSLPGLVSTYIFRGRNQGLAGRDRPEMNSTPRNPEGDRDATAARRDTTTVRARDGLWKRASEDRGDHDHDAVRTATKAPGANAMRRPCNARHDPAETRIAAARDRTDTSRLLTQLGDNTNQDIIPVLDVNRMAVPLQPTANLFDILSEPGPSTSTASQQLNSERRHNPQLPTIKNEECLIDFSSASSSVESAIDSIDNSERQNEDTQLNVLPIKMENLSLDHPVETIQTLDTTTQLAGTLNLSELSKCALPPQEILQIDTIYTAYIFNVDDLSMWVITDDPEGLFSEIFARMEDYYYQRTDFVPAHMLENLSYCAYFDIDTSTWYRCYILEAKYTGNKAQLYFVDTGKIQVVSNDKLQPLYPEFCTLPPFARTCHLAGIDVEDQSFESLSKVTKFVSQFTGFKCQIEVEDNTSESMACYVRLEDNRTINHMLVENGLAVHIGGECTCNSVQENIMKSQAIIPENLATLVPSVDDIVDCPEYEDALVAVTGYHNRDEAEICKHYKGPPNKTCFKGERCKKRHILMHPDGWTLDKTEVLCKAPTLSLPAPGTVCDVRVTYVLHCNKVYVQFVTPPKSLRRRRPFGVITPPETLEELVRDMNSRAVLPTYRTLRMAPAPGELVAAVYPLDKKWYRARVLTHSPSDQTVEVQYVDYGTEFWVKECQVCELQSMYTHLPFQSVLCTLAEVKLRNQEAATLAKVKKYLTIMAQDKVHEALIISRSFDELEVVLIDKEGMNVAKKLADTGLVDYEVRKVDIRDFAWKAGNIPPEI
ncbi:hypothetical protein EVAR_38941_1 [Eumeta japonica]|uniref:Tudor domain-containing protein 1 n=1 Tax=Eumeta variegata TaxID=151549 RepID=A0A4C1W8X5_EUMVA|nr:hypothetical protein EVAR_38941_1 [Eumeta japonica]